MFTAKKAPNKLSDQLNILVDDRSSGKLSEFGFRSKKRTLLRIDSFKLSPHIKWLALCLAVSLMLLGLVWSVPSSRRTVLLGLLFGLVIASHISRAIRWASDDPYDFSIEKFVADVTEPYTRWRASVGLDVTPPPVDLSAPATPEHAALRFLRDTGELTKREFTAAKSIADGTFRPSRGLAYLSITLILLNVAALVALPFGPAPEAKSCVELTVACLEQAMRAK